MKNNKFLLIVIALAAVLIGAICIVTVILVSDREQSDRYYEQMRSARQYWEEGDFASVVAAYEAAIEIRPEDPEAYVELAGLYAEHGMYAEAREVAEKGFSVTRDHRLEALLEEINQDAFVRGPENTDEPEPSAEFVAEGEDSENLALQYASVRTLTDYCYAELVAAYGQPSVSFVSDEEGYQMRFNGINGYAYFRNTEEYPYLIDTSTRVPQDNARPYKYMILTPSWIFVGFNGYISNARLCSLFGGEAEIAYNEGQQTWQSAFTWDNCSVVLETDSEGNVYQSDACVEIYPQEQLKEDWEEPTEEETEPAPETFTLGSQTFTYDVTSISLYGEVISDLSPLEECKELRSLELMNCVLGGDIAPLAGCAALVNLNLRGSVGFSDISPLASLPNLLSVDLHSCTGVSDLSPIMEKELRLLHTCHTGVTYEQTMEYKQRYPACEVWYDSRII